MLSRRGEQGCPPRAGGHAAILPQMSTEEHVAVVDEPGEELPPTPPAPLVVPRGIQMVLLLVALLALWVAARAARKPFRLAPVPRLLTSAQGVPIEIYPFHSETPRTFG